MFSSGVTPGVHNQPMELLFWIPPTHSISPTLSASLESPWTLSTMPIPVIVPTCQDQVAGEEGLGEGFAPPHWNHKLLGLREEDSLARALKYLWPPAVTASLFLPKPWAKDGHVKHSLHYCPLLGFSQSRWVVGYKREKKKPTSGSMVLWILVLPKLPATIQFLESLNNCPRHFV